MRWSAIIVLFISAFSFYSAKADQWDGQLINVSYNSGDSFDQRLLDAKKCAIARIKKYTQKFQGQLNSIQMTTLNGMVSNLSTVTLRKVNLSANGPGTWYDHCQKNSAYMTTPFNYTGYIVVCPILAENGFGNMALCETLVHESFHTTDNHENPPPGGYSQQVILDKEANATMYQYTVMENTNPSGIACHYATAYGEALKNYLAQNGVYEPPLCSDYNDSAYMASTASR